MTQAPARWQVVGVYLLALLPFFSIPLLGSQLYFRHDDSGLLLWAREFDGPLHHAFSTDPELNRYKEYRGVGPYWRPVSRLVMLGVLRWAGPDPMVFHLLFEGLFIVGVLAFLVMVRSEWGPGTAFLTSWLLFGAFYRPMYNLFLINIPQGYFYQLLAVASFIWLLRRGGWPPLMATALALIPAMHRQTTPLLLLAIWVVWFAIQRRQQLLSRTAATSLAVVIGGIALITLSNAVGGGSVIARWPHLDRMAAWVTERFWFYGRELTTGVGGVLLLSLFSWGLLDRLFQRLRPPEHTLNRTPWPAAVMALLGAILLTGLPQVASVYLAACMVLLFLVDDRLRLPLAWAATSLCAYLSLNFFHTGYLLEATFPLALAMGVLAGRLLGPVCTRRFGHWPPGRLAAIGAGSAVVGVGLLGVAWHRPLPLVESRLAPIRIAVHTNRTFSQLMEYLFAEMPAGPVYELPERALGTTSRQRRHLPMAVRAARTKVMNGKDMEAMLRVLGRSDLKVRPVRRWKPSEGPGFLVALNRFERRVVEDRFQVEVVKELHSGGESAAVYRLLGRRSADPQ